MNYNVSLVFLAGGKGNRINRFTKKTPKPLLKLSKNEFLQDLINCNSKFNVDKIFILSGYKSYKFKKKYSNKYNNLLRTILIEEEKPLDTGGALAQLKNIKGDVILINGDTFFDIDLNDFIKKSKLNKSEITIALTKNNKTQSKKLSQLSLTKEGFIKIKKNSKFKNAGIYYLKNKFLKSLIKKKISLENDILPNKIKQKKVKGIFFKNKFIDIGSYEQLKIGKKVIPEMLKKPAIILDRDGVINYDYGYVSNFKKFKFRPGVLKALKYLIKKNIYIFIATNQAGIGKKIFKEEDFFRLHKQLKLFLSKKKIYINDIKYCPHHPKAKLKEYKIKCKCRKPGNKMITELIDNWNISKKKIFMIGDKKTDQEAALSSKIKFQFVKKNLFNQITNMY